MNATQDPKDGGAGFPPSYPASAAWTTAGLMTFIYLLSLLDRTILSLLIEFIQADLGISDTQFGLLQGMTFAIFFLVAGLPIGWLVDRRSRVAIITTGLAVWSVMTFLSGFATRFLHLFLARIGVAAGEAALNPAVYSMFADIFPKQKLSRALAIFLAGSMIGNGLAYAVGGALVAFFGSRPTIDLPLIGELRVWQMAFIAAGLPGILLAAMLPFFVREPKRIGTGADALSVSNRQVAGFLRQHRKPLSLHFCAFALMTIQSYSFFSWGPAFLFRIHDLSAGQVGIAMGIAAGVFGPLGFYSGGLLADHFVKNGRVDAHMRVGMGAMVLSIPCALAVVFAPTPIMSMLMLSPLMFTLMAPTAAAIAGLQLMLPPLLRGRVSAVFMAITNLAGVGLGPLLVALLNDYAFGTGQAIAMSMAIVTVVVAPLAALAFGLGRHPLGRAIAQRNSDELASRAADARKPHDGLEALAIRQTTLTID